MRLHHIDDCRMEEGCDVGHAARALMAVAHDGAGGGAGAQSALVDRR